MASLFRRCYETCVNGSLTLITVSSGGSTCLGRLTGSTRRWIRRCMHGMHWTRFVAVMTASCVTVFAVVALYLFRPRPIIYLKVYNLSDSLLEHQLFEENNKMRLVSECIACLYQKLHSQVHIIELVVKHVVLGVILRKHYSSILYSLLATI